MNLDHWLDLLFKMKSLKHNFMTREPRRSSCNLPVYLVKITNFTGSRLRARSCIN